MVQAVIPTTVTGLQGNPIATTTPTNGQVLAWSGTAWTPAGPFSTIPVSPANGGTGGTTAAAGLAGLSGAPLNRAVRPSLILVGQPGFSSGSAVHGGWGNNGWTITPVGSGTVLFGVITFVNNNLAGTPVWTGLRFGTGTPPAQGAAATGSQLGTQAFSTQVAGQAFPIAITGVARGLAVGTQYWFDMVIQVGQGASQITNPTGFAAEI